MATSVFAFGADDGELRTVQGRHSGMYILISQNHVVGPNHGIMQRQITVRCVVGVVEGGDSDVSRSHDMNALVGDGIIQIAQVRRDRQQNPSGARRGDC
jgi:hypothetical protein